MALRTFPTQANHGANTTGPEFATLLATEGNALWDRVINQVGSVAGTADVITGVCTPALTADPADGQTFRLTPAANNTSATVTINLDSRGAITLKDCDGAALVADDLVSGRPITFYRHGVSGNYRLMGPTQRALIAALAASISAGNTGWEQFGDTTISAPVSLVDHAFTLGAYSKIVSIASGLSGSGTNVHLDVLLRQAGGTIVTLTGNSSAGADTIVPADFMVAEAEFLIDVVSATKIHTGVLSGRLGSGSAVTEVFNYGTHATGPTSVRWQYGVGNIDAGRIMSYGLKA